MKLPYFVPGLLIVLLALGCARPPLAEMNNAREAVSRAENDPDTAIYAGNSIARARDALNRMQTEANSKRYDAAKSFAAEAETAASKAIADGRAGAARAREEAAVLVASLPPAIAETEQSLQAASSAMLKLDYESLASDFNLTRLNADQAQIALSENHYQDALERGRNAKAGLSDINQQLSAAATASSRKK